jgi:Zn-dependent protease
VALRSLLVFAGAFLLAWTAHLPLHLMFLVAAAAALVHFGFVWWLRVASYGIRVDAAGIHRIDPRGDVTIRWSDLRSIDLAETPTRLRGRPIRLRYIVLESRGPERILFADLSPIGSPTIRIDLGGPQPIVDVNDSGVLLAVVAERAGDERYLPEVLLDHSRPEAAAGPEAAAPAEGPGERRQVSFGGLLALVAKVGSKFAKGIPAALKTFKVGTVGVSAALYGVFFSWQFAVAIVVMLAFHEYGHVHAMRRSGLRVRGIYFIPLLGAASVTDDVWRSREEQAFIALAGPLWGLGLTGLALAVDAATGFAHPLVGVVVSWWALLNLFNLLPVNPLDGGRVLSAIGHSLGTRFALVAVVLTFLGALVLAAALDITLLAVVGIIGLLEFASETATSIRFRRVFSAPRVAALSPAGLATLKGLARPSLGEDTDQAYFHFEMRNARRMQRMASIRPMSRAQALRWGLAYLAVTAALVAVLLVAGGAHPGAALARELVR